MTNIRHDPRVQAAANERLLRPKEIAEALAVSRRWILYQYEHGRIPAAFRRGRVIRFKLEDVMEALTRS
jgi:excisionase family DNA binding protein